MKGDFSRNTFDPTKHFLRVLMQQGRVQLDADWNEQTAILLHYLQTLAADIIGEHGGPSGGFSIDVLRNKDLNPTASNPENPIPNNFVIRGGHYYVNGILCENEQDTAFTAQVDYPLYEWPAASESDTDAWYLIYLDVWERHLTHVQDESMREIALNGPDTATRARVVWQVKLEGGIQENTTCSTLDWNGKRQSWQPDNRGLLRARAQPGGEIDATDPCILPPDARYRGAENQLYRVEVHRGGTASAARFKWSRDNGTVLFPIAAIDGARVTLEHLGTDSRLSLKRHDWVEFVDDATVLLNQPQPMRRVERIDPVKMIITLDQALTVDPQTIQKNHAILRRWDQKESPTDVGEADTAKRQVNEDGVKLREGNREADWLHLEDGIQIQFQRLVDGAGNQQTMEYRAGDYWLIPARTITGDVIWPQENGSPAPIPPHGVTHHYAPLAIISVSALGNVTIRDHCRRSLRGGNIVTKDRQPGS